MGDHDDGRKDRPDDARKRLLERIDRATDGPLAVLGFVWLILIVIDLVSTLPPALWVAVEVIWGIFIVDFLIEFILATRKTEFLRKNVLTALALFVPAFRVFRVFAALRSIGLLRSLRLVNILGTGHRGMRVLGEVLHRRGFAYVVVLTVIVILLGAAGIYAFERNVSKDMTDFGSALFWAAMMMTTMGSGYWPKTAQGRILCFILALYSFSIFGYVTAVIASYFVNQDAKERGAAESSRTAAKPGDRDLERRPIP